MASSGGVAAKRSSRESSIKFAAHQSRAVVWRLLVPFVDVHPFGEDNPASVSSGNGSGNLVVHPHFPEEVHLQFPRLHCQLVIQNPSRDVINELEFLVELIL